MSDITNEDVVQALGNLSVLQVIALTKELEAKWGVKAEPVFSTSNQSVVPDTQSTQSEFDVVMESVPTEKRISVIKVVRETLVMGLKESKELVESLPKTVLAGASKDDAEKLKAKLVEAGAVVEVK